LNKNFQKLSGGISSLNSNSNPTNKLDLFQETSEEEQMQRIIEAAMDDARLDMFTPTSDKAKLHKEEEEDEEPKRQKKKTQKPIPSSKKTSKSKIKRRGHSSDSESSSSSSSSDIEEDSDFKEGEKDDELTKRKKSAMRQLYLDEKTRKAKAYEEWKKNNKF